MPIRPELKHFYKTPEYRAARERVIARAKNRCEQCGKPNGEMVETCSGRTLSLMGNPGRKVMCWRAAGSSWVTWCGVKMNAHPRFSVCTRMGKVRTIRVVLTCAHLNHNPSDNSDENLRFLCQWCHLNYDMDHHRETRSIRKDAKRPLQWEGAISV